MEELSFPKFDYYTQVVPYPNKQYPPDPKAA